MDDIEAALSSGDPDALRRALTHVATLHRELDDLERRTVDTARRAGLTWTEIAAGLNLGSRQAAEQRRLRLGGTGPTRDVARSRATRRDLRAADDFAGVRVARLRATAGHVADTLAVAAPATHADLVRLAQQTLRTATGATPGALVDLATLAAADLSRIPRAAAPALGAALDALNSALAAARSLDSRDDQ